MNNNPTFGEVRTFSAHIENTDMAMKFWDMLVNDARQKNDRGLFIRTVENNAMVYSGAVKGFGVDNKRNYHKVIFMDGHSVIIDMSCVCQVDRMEVHDNIEYSVIMDSKMVFTFIMKNTYFG